MKILVTFLALAALTQGFVSCAHQSSLASEQAPRAEVNAQRAQVERNTIVIQ